MEIMKNILEEEGVLKAGVFGSYARGEQKKNSDIDILIEIDSEKSLLDLISIKLRLEKELKKKIDLVEYCTLHPMVKKDVLQEEIKII